MILLAACTQAKRGITADNLLFRRHIGSDRSPHVVHRSWQRAVASARDTSPAGQVYKGNYWRTVQGLGEQLGASVTVVSAGMGLITEASLIPCYSATFVSGNADSVPAADTLDGRRAWWALLGGNSAMRSMSLDEPLVVVLPSTYLRIVEPDLAALVEHYGPERVAIFGPPEGAKGGPLEKSWIPVEARMAWASSANAASLAPAVAKHAIQSTTTSLDHALYRRRAAALLNGAAPTAFPKRERQTPAQVRAWIRARLIEANPPTSASTALRQFRDAGLAHEQRAFHEAFHQVQASLRDPHA